MRCLAAFLLLALIAVLAPSSAHGQQPSWALCPQAPTDIAVQSVDISLVNRTLSLVMNATVDEQLTQGSQVAIAVDLNGGQIFSENIDMAQGTTLPIAANSAFLFKYGVSIPSIAPAGAYSVDLTFLDQTGTPLACIVVNFNLSKEEELIALE